MRKKSIFTALVMINLAVIPTLGQRLRLELRVEYFKPTDKTFDKLYSARTMYGMELNIRAWKSLELWAEVMYFNSEGKLEITKEKTEITLLPTGTGLKIKLGGNKDRINGYMGFGIRSYAYKEINSLAEIKSKGIGYVGKLGFFVKIVKGLLIDIYANFSTCSVKPSDLRAELGGIHAGLGLGYEF